MNRTEILQAVAKDHIRKHKKVLFAPGDVVKVNLKIKEGDKERVQAFEGVVIGRKGGGLQETFKVRRIASGVGVERTFLIHSPLIESVEVIKRGEVRRAKLYYLRGKTGKNAKIKMIRRDKLLQIQAEELKAMEAEQEASALQAAAEAATRETGSKTDKTEAAKA